MQPVLFISHGAPTLLTETSASNTFLRKLGTDLLAANPRPKAILCISAHWTTGEPQITQAERAELIYDFYGFPQELNEFRYPVLGNPFAAKQVIHTLQEAGFPCSGNETRGLDHGAWVPLSLMFPQADIPVLQISVQPSHSALHHYKLGEALRALRSEGYLVIASGSATHNLRVFRGQSIDSPLQPQAKKFLDTFLPLAQKGDVKTLLEWRDRIPEARWNHPTPEHFIPFFVAMGAATNPKATLLHSDIEYGFLSMASFAWYD